MYRFIIVTMLLVVQGVCAQNSFKLLKDSSKQLDLTAVKNMRFSEIEDVNLGFDNGVYWFKLDSIPTDRHIYTLNTHHVDDLYAVDNKGQTIALVDRSQYPAFFFSKTLHAFPIYVRANFKNEAFFPFEDFTGTSYANKRMPVLMGVGLFYGILIALIFSTLIYYLFTKDKLFLFHTGTFILVFITMAIKDNIPYLFDFNYSFIPYLEVITHFLIGTAGLVYGMNFLKLEPEQKRKLKFALTGLVLLSFIALGIYIFGRSIYASFFVDLFAAMTISGMWLVSIFKKNRSAFNGLIIWVYSINIFVFIDLFLLQTAGMSFLGEMPAIVKSVILIDIALMSISMIHSFRKMQNVTVILNRKIENYREKVKILDSRNQIQDTNDTYLENLIRQFDLENAEIKVLQGLSNGLSYKEIQEQTNFTRRQIKKVEESLYAKLGLDSTDIRMMAS